MQLHQLHMIYYHLLSMYIYIYRYCIQTEGISHYKASLSIRTKVVGSIRIAHNIFVVQLRPTKFFSTGAIWGKSTKHLHLLSNTTFWWESRSVTSLQLVWLCYACLGAGIPMVSSFYAVCWCFFSPIGRRFLK